MHALLGIDPSLPYPQRTRALASALRCLRLPSTSPANASQPAADKLQRWRQSLLAAGLEVRALPTSD